MKHEYCGPLPVRWAIWGKLWWLNVQRLVVDHDMVMWGLKIGPIGIYVRWSIPEAKK